MRNVPFAAVRSPIELFICAVPIAAEPSRRCATLRSAFGRRGLSASFCQAKINRTWIESFPAQTPKPEYLFFVDFEGHQEDPKVARTLKGLAEHCEQLVVLSRSVTVSGIAKEPAQPRTSVSLPA